MLAEQDQDAAVVLTVCPSPETWSMLRQALRDDDGLFSLREAASAAEALRAVGVPPWDIDGIVLGAQLPAAERADLLDKLRAADFDRAVVVLTDDGAEPELNGHRHGLIASTIDLRDVATAPGLLPRALVAAIEARRRAHFETEVHRLRAERDALERGMLQALEALAAAIAARELHAGTGRRELCAVEIARDLGLVEAEQRGLWAAALLHDIGKMVVPDEVLNKPGPLTPTETKHMQTHAEVGARLLELVELPWPIADAVRCHHERFDGSGYPRGIAGDAIPLSARILAVADVYGALTADRPYRPALSPRAAAQFILDHESTLFDPQVVRAFARAVGRVEALLRVRPAERAASNGDAGASAGGRGSPVTAIRAAHEEAAALTRLAERLAAAATACDAATAVTAAIGELLHAAECAVYLMRRGGAVECVAAAGADAPPPHSLEIADQHTLATRVLGGGKTISHGTPGERWRTGQSSCSGGEVTAAPLSLPAGRQVGVVMAAVPPGLLPPQEIVRRLEAIAHRAAAPLEQALSRDEARAAACRDAVSGLPDRRCFEQELTRELAWCRRSNAAGCVLYLALDDFRAFEREQGRDRGDALLRHIGNALSSAARAHDLVARAGDDEFVVMARRAGMAAARRLAKRLRDAVAHADAERPERVRCTIGIAEYGAEVPSVEVPLAAARNAMCRMRRVRGRG